MNDVQTRNYLTIKGDKELLFFSHCNGLCSPLVVKNSSWLLLTEDWGVRVIAAQTPLKRSPFSFCTVLSQQDCDGRARGPVVGRHRVGDAVLPRCSATRLLLPHRRPLHSAKAARAAVFRPLLMWSHTQNPEPDLGSFFFHSFRWELYPWESDSNYLKLDI